MKDAFDFLDEIAQQEQKERRARILEESRVLAEAEAQKAREAKARVDAISRRANESFLIDEYDRAGVEPPFTNGHGIPTVSLSLLMSNGWRIEEMGADRVLMKP